MESLAGRWARPTDGRRLETGVHAAAVMAEGFPDRMKPDFGRHRGAGREQALRSEDGKGYAYAPDKGQAEKERDPATYELTSRSAGHARVRAGGHRRALHGAAAGEPRRAASRRRSSRHCMSDMSLPTALASAVRGGASVTSTRRASPLRGVCDRYVARQTLRGAEAAARHGRSGKKFSADPALGIHGEIKMNLNPRDVVIIDGVRSAMGWPKGGMFRNAPRYCRSN